MNATLRPGRTELGPCATPKPEAPNAADAPNTATMPAVIPPMPRARATRCPSIRRSSVALRAPYVLYVYERPLMRREHILIRYLLQIACRPKGGRSAKTRYRPPNFKLRLVCARLGRTTDLLSWVGTRPPRWSAPSPCTRCCERHATLTCNKELPRLRGARLSALPRRYEPQPAIGAAVRQLRYDRNLTQRQLAAKADVEPTWISRLELGHANPSLATLHRLANALGVPLSQLIALSEEQGEPPRARIDRPPRRPSPRGRNR